MDYGKMKSMDQLENNSERPASPAEETAPLPLTEKERADRLSRRIEETNERRQQKQRRFWIKTVLLIALIAFSIFLLFSITDSLTEDSIKSIPALIAGIDWKWFACLLGVVVLYMLFESSKYAYLLKISTGHFHFRAAIKVMFLGKYYDGITPLGSGGQPFQIYYLHKKNGIPAGVATAVPLVKFIISTVVFCSMAAVLFSFAHEFLPGSTINTALLIVAWISMGANFLMPVCIILFSLFPNFGKKVIAWIVHLLAKLHIVKRKYTVMHRYIFEMREYRNSLKAILGKWWHIPPLMVIAFVCGVLHFSVPFFVTVALAGVAPTMGGFLQMLCLSVLSFYAASLIPTPGNSGALEGAAAIIFSAALSATAGGVVGWVVLTWRFLTYYIYIFSGVGINIFEVIRGAYRNRRARAAEKRAN